jgi:hypothetical protein
MHSLEAFVPCSERRHAADEIANRKAPGRNQPDHALPHLPVVREAALQDDVFLDERVQAEAQGFPPPANSCDLARRPDSVDRELQGPSPSSAASAPSWRANSSLGASTGNPLTIRCPAPLSFAISAQHRPIGPGPITSTESPGRMRVFTQTAL